MKNKLSFSFALTLSLGVHLMGGACMIIGARPFKSKSIKIAPAHVVWTHTVKRKKQTPENKLPPPEVSRDKKVDIQEEVVKLEDKQNTPDTKPETKKNNRKQKLADALKKINQQVKDDRPTPKDDNFASGDQDQNKPLSPSQLEALKSSPIMNQYTQDLQLIIIDNFLWYQSDTQWVTKVEIKLAADGTIENANIIESSGSSSFDQATIRAVEKSSPLPPPPATLASLFRQETIVFAFQGSQL